MICNKCGKNNSAGADRCSACGEIMPAESNCGGFSDILTYSAQPKPAKPEVDASAPVHTERQINMEKPTVNTELVKRSIIFSIASMAVSVLVLIGFIICTVIVVSSVNNTHITSREDSYQASSGDSSDNVSNVTGKDEHDESMIGNSLFNGEETEKEQDEPDGIINEAKPDNITKEKDKDKNKGKSSKNDVSE